MSSRCPVIIVVGMRVRLLPLRSSASTQLPRTGSLVAVIVLLPPSSLQGAGPITAFFPPFFHCPAYACYYRLLKHGVP